MSIGEIWGKPDVSKPTKTKLVENGLDTNPRKPKEAKLDEIKGKYFSG